LIGTFKDWVKKSLPYIKQQYKEIKTE